MSKHTPEYLVTGDGRVLSVTSNWRGYGEREMMQTLNSDGYPSVRLTINSKRVHLAVHHLVAKAHLPAKPTIKHEIRHLDGNKLNAHYKNLAWGTKKENAEDRECHGRTSRGLSHSVAIKQSNHKERVKRGNDHYITKRRSAIAKAEGK